MLNLTDILTDIIYQNKIIKQGGNAFNYVKPIKLQHIKNTIQHFIDNIITPTLHISKYSKDLFTLGSTGKKPQSGDIDLALNINFIKLSLDDIIKKLYSYTKLNTNIEVILNSFQKEMIQFAYPIIGEKNSYVQIDLLLTKYPTFTKWYMYSPSPKESKYKAAHKNDMIRAIIKTLTYKSLKTINYKDVTWQQEDITPFGLYFQIQTLVDNNNNFLTYKDTNQPLLPMYAKPISSKEISHSPIFVINKYIGNYLPQQINSFETMYKIITSNNFKFKEDSEDILYNAAKAFKLNDKLEFPKELLKYQ